MVDNAGTGRGATYSYTDSGRLASANGPWGNESYQYDAAGNRTRRTLGSTVEAAVPEGASNRVTLVTDGATPTPTTLRTIGFRAGGDVASDAYAGGSTFLYGYNARKRLVSMTKDGVVAGTYGYDPFGRRVWRNITGSVQRQYVFDRDGHLLAEHDAATGAVVKEYVWLDDLPIAMIDSSSGTAQVYSITTGAVDEPLMMNDASQARAWDAYVDAYGGATILGTPTASLELRLPGQQLQIEADGLHQNGFRDYDPTLGRYAEADPIGIDAGQNVYAYVDGRPLEFSDVFGLFGGSEHLDAATAQALARMFPGRPKPLGKTYGTESCAHYSAACRSNGGLYYCSIAPTVCGGTPDSRWTRCVRECLQQNDQIYCGSQPAAICSNTNLGCIVDIHRMCWLDCLGSGIPASTARKNGRKSK